VPVPAAQASHNAYAWVKWVLNQFK
jgi:hypothetical protein